jgi:uncharacterized protein YjaZ
MRQKTTKQEEEKKSWEQPYKQGNIREKKEQYNLFLVYKNMGVTRSIDKLKQYCDEHKTELHEQNVSFPRTPGNILQLEKQIPLG